MFVFRTQLKECSMNGTLSIQGDLVLLGKLAVKIDEWFPSALATEVRPDEWGGWTIETMEVLLERLHPWQLLLVSYVAQSNGRRNDPEVRDKFAIGASGLRGQTGAISKHIYGMKAAGKIADNASYLLKVDRSAHMATFVMPAGLVPIVQAALTRPSIELALNAARRLPEGLDKRD
jgi:hypothetical protein